MSIWYKGNNTINCEMSKISLSLEDLGKHYTGVIKFMPGLTSVELIEEGNGFVSIKTNEGMMNRTNIIIEDNGSEITVEFDEAYQTKMKINVISHYKHVFTQKDDAVVHSLIISDVNAAGMLGLLYRTFGKASIGKAILEANEQYLSNDK